jgi:hypothetical protein
MSAIWGTRGDANTALTIVIEMTQRPALALVTVIRSLRIKQARFTDSGVTTFDAQTDPLTWTCLNLNTSPIAAAICVTRTAKVSITHLLITITQLMRLTT